MMRTVVVVAPLIVGAAMSIGVHARSQRPALATASTRPATQTVPPRGPALEDLTVPSERLPAGCALSPAPSVSLDGNRVRVGLWAGFPSNPWSGTDRRLTASIRELVETPASVPDGPPLGAREFLRYRGQLADGVEAAYGAVYVDDAKLITVQAVRLAANEQRIARPGDNRLSSSQRMIRVEIGRIAAVVTGDGACFQTIGAYLKSLANQPY